MKGNLGEDGCVLMRPSSARRGEWKDLGCIFDAELMNPCNGVDEEIGG